MKTVLTVLALVCSAAALRIPTTSTTRRAAMGGVAAATLGLVTPQQASAGPGLKPCPKGANNCFSSADEASKVATWTWPKSMERAAAIADLKAALETYPQAGQAGVDLGGWAVVDDKLTDTGYGRAEFKSGIGNFAKFFNGGKPFIDDLEFSVEDATVCVRSSSRVGDSDFGVNGKRLNFIAAELTKRGWDAKAIAL